MRRRRLLRTGALGAVVGAAGCVGSVTDAVADDVRFTSALSTLHAVSDPWVRGGFGDGGIGNFRGELFTETPEERPFVGGRYGRRDATSHVLGADYEREFVLLHEVLIRRSDPFRVDPTARDRDPTWADRRELVLPLSKDPVDPEHLAFDLRDEEELVCTTVVTYAVGEGDEPMRVTPESALVHLYGYGTHPNGRSIVVE
ncbi:hypothetical protein ACFO0N_13035 [Halobium salinum]|uniref:Lipoprotein n=1 Tax=Halobium salinum TaxID=1364940 RepID=A0ABD5PDF5_9EURY|nr:hypothetical protein [Halobium salinum]